MENKAPDKIKEKLFKLKALAEQGYEGEARSAQKALENLTKAYI